MRAAHLPPPDIEIERRLRPRRPRRARWLGLVLLLALAAVGIVLLRTYRGALATFEAQDAYLSEAEAAFESIPLLDDHNIAQLRRSRNARHVALAQHLGVGPPATRAEVDSLARAGALVRIQTGDRWVVLEGGASVPYLTPGAAASLDSIAARFADRLATRGLPPFRFTVSSGLRSTDDQAALRQTNVNAAAGRSSHEFGTTYDITYNPTRYSPAPDAMPPPPEIDERVPGVFRPVVAEGVAARQREMLDGLAANYPSRLSAALGRALIELEDEGVLVTVRERRQPVYHTTVAQRLVPEPDAALADG